MGGVWLNYFFRKKKKKTETQKRKIKKQSLWSESNLCSSSLCRKKKVSISSIRLPVVLSLSRMILPNIQKMQTSTSKSLSFLPSSFLVLLHFNLPKYKTSPFFHFFSTFLLCKCSLSPNSYLHENGKGKWREATSFFASSTSMA